MILILVLKTLKKNPLMKLDLQKYKCSMFNVREEMECLLFCNRESCTIFDRFIADLIYCELHTFFEALSSYLHSMQSSNM